MRTRSLWAVASGAVVGLILGIAPSAASGQPQEASGPDARSQAARSAHYSGKPLLNPRADLSRPLAMEPAAPPLGKTSPTTEIGDGRFPTWTGYAVQRFPASGYLQSVDPLFPPTGIVVLINQGP